MTRCPLQSSDLIPLEPEDTAPWGGASFRSGKAPGGKGLGVGVGFLGLQVEVGKYQVPCGILNHFHCEMSVSRVCLQHSLDAYTAPALPLSDLLDEILDLHVTTGLASDRLAISASPLALASFPQLSSQ